MSNGEKDKLSSSVKGFINTLFDVIAVWFSIETLVEGIKSMLGPVVVFQSTNSADYRITYIEVEIAVI